MKTPLQEPYLLTPLDNFLPQRTEYAHLIFFFRKVGIERDAIAQPMRIAFARLMDALPWIAGSVTPIKHESQHGRLPIAAPWKTVDDFRTVNHLDYLDYAELKAEHFPMRALVEEEVWPQTKWTGRPTLQAQINFIQGGIIIAWWEWVSTRTGASPVSALRTISDLITYRSIRMALRTKNPIDEGTTLAEDFFFSAARLRELKEVITASRKAEKQPESKA